MSQNLHRHSGVDVQIGQQAPAGTPRVMHSDRTNTRSCATPVPESEEVRGSMGVPYRVLLQRTDDVKVGKERMHIDLESDDVEAEVRRLEGLGATCCDHQQARGYDFWVMRDPWGNEFCVLQPEFPELIARRLPWDEASGTRSNSRGD